MRVRGRTWWIVVACGALLAPACAAEEELGPEAAAADPVAAAEAPSAEPTEGRAVDLIGELTVDPTSGPAGTEVTVTGRDLPASAPLSVLWATAECDWVISGDANEEYHGRECVDTERPLGEVTTDATGAFTTTFVAPDDYGFAHDVLVVDAEDVERNRALFWLGMEVSVTPESGPVGTPITIEVRGMGYRSLEDTRTILYDNRYVGFMSAVTTTGTARAVIPAVGAPGPHRIEINRGAYTFPYLNPEQSPRPDILTFEATFTVTEGDPVLPPPIEDQIPAVQMRDPVGSGDGPWIVTDVASGPVGTPMEIRGDGFDAGTDIELLWYRIVGNRVGGQGWEERAITLAETTAGGDGSFVLAAEIPGDVGGPHRLAAMVADSNVAETTVAVTPSADPIPTQVRWGDDVVLHLEGVGWTETANIYTIVYDDTYVGYACGFNTQGDVLVTLAATGEPGWHFVDLYPAIYKGEEKPGRDNFRIPQLTAVDDHPGEDLPIFRFAFEIVP